MSTKKQPSLHARVSRKQKTPKKVSGAKRKASGKRSLVSAYDDQCFWATDGRVLSNLLELRDYLSSVADDVFKYHVTREKNDFANWVETVLGDNELAASLRRSKLPGTARTVVVRRLKVYDI